MQKTGEQICFYSDASEWGGQEILSARMANSLRGIFKDIFFFYSCPQFSKVLDENIQKVPLPFSASTPFPILRDRSVKKRKAVEFLFKKYRVKNLVICPGNIERCLPAVFAASRQGIRIVSYYPMAYSQQETGAVFGRLRDFLAKQIYPKISEWVVITRAQERLLRRFISKDVPVHILPNPYGGEISEKVHTPQFPLRIGSVGRIYFAQKGQDAIPQMAQSLKRRKFPFSFQVFGDGPDAEKLRAQIQKKDVEKEVILHGWIPGAELRKKLENEIDIVLISSHFEGDPMILYEALGCGVPLLVSRADYMQEYGLPDWMLYDSKDPEDPLRKLEAYPHALDPEEFRKVRTRLFKGRSDRDFCERAQKIFTDIFNGERA